MHPLLLPLMLAGPKAGIVETVALSGTQGSPTLRTYIDEASGTVNLYFVVASQDSGAPANINKGNVEWTKYIEGNQAVYTGISTASTWVNVKDYAGTYWVKLTLDAGDACNGVSSATFGVWHALSGSNIFFGWQTSSVVAITDGTVKVEIADNTPQDSNIVATGYYQGRVRASSGA
jgi:hypothetical protein